MRPPGGVSGPFLRAQELLRLPERTAQGPTGWVPPLQEKGGRDRFRYSTGAFGLVSHGHVRLSRIGCVRTKEPTTKLIALVDQGKARISSATVSRHADRWFVSFCCEVDRDDPKARTGEPVGIDRGLHYLAVCSDGEMVGSPQALQRHLRKLRRLSRSVSRKPKGSHNRAKARLALARCHRKIANIRRDHLHKVTTNLARTKRVIVIEDLHIGGMVRNRSLARAISDAGWSEFARMLAYKCSWYGSTLIVADRFLPSSKTCSECGTVKEELPLSQRTFRCEDCGVVLDRDLNAAKNLARLCGPVAASAAETQNACGGERFMGSAQVLPEEAGRERS
ncbi:MAG: RNA-guided endonuclease InsQ/TnpB family protein [Actinomycetota bacterium]